MAKFNFCLTVGRDGFPPDDQIYVAADCAVDAYDAIVGQIKDFIWLASECDDDSAEEADWKGFFDRGCRMPDASTWNFTLATSFDTNLSVIGMTQEEFDRESIA